MLKFISLVILALGLNTALACTHITVQSTDNTLIVGRTMEFGPNLNSQIKAVPAKFTFTNTAPNGKMSKSWNGQYGFIYMNGFGIDLAVDGMNEKGLSISGLYLPGYTTYAKPTDENIQNGIPYLQLGAYLLSQFDSIDAVKTDLNDLTIFDQPMDLPDHPKVSFPLHFAVTDKSGQSIVIEFINGKTIIYDNPIGILTNSPTFDWQMTNLKNYVNLSPYSPKVLHIDGYQYSATGQGAGMIGLPGDTTPPSRFVKMAFLSKTAKPVNNAQQAVVLAQHILANVYIPNGLVRGEKGTENTETTQWTVLKDLTHSVMYFKSYQYPALRAIDFNKVDFNSNKSLAIEQPAPLAIDVTKAIN
ncbi:linear amide C-N hydrolase [Legionella nagasakiensis]|uniref:linear amide C-N hydrolase n=1 Tax=Legionella nagasakiensis TaxID=535290 RepID=UPI001054611B|nr:choloylglycine hydrolase family protein [Legionella nagasakiensis]